MTTKNADMTVAGVAVYERAPDGKLFFFADVRDIPQHLAGTVPTGANLLCPLGGGLEQGETVIQCAARELAEEVGEANIDNSVVQANTSILEKLPTLARGPVYSTPEPIILELSKPEKRKTADWNLFAVDRAEILASGVKLVFDEAKGRENKTVLRFSLADMAKIALADALDFPSGGDRLLRHNGIGHIYAIQAAANLTQDKSLRIPNSQRALRAKLLDTALAEYGADNTAVKRAALKQTIDRMSVADATAAYRVVKHVQAQRILEAERTLNAARKRRPVLIGVVSAVVGLLAGASAAHLLSRGPMAPVGVQPVAMPEIITPVTPGTSSLASDCIVGRPADNAIECRNGPALPRYLVSLDAPADSLRPEVAAAVLAVRGMYAEPGFASLSRPAQRTAIDGRLQDLRAPQ